MENWCNEFKSLNPNVRCDFTENRSISIFIENFEFTRNVVEFKSFTRGNGNVVYAFVYDYSDTPLIVGVLSCENEYTQSFVDFFKTLKQITEGDKENRTKDREFTFIISYDKVLVDALEENNLLYFIKTRSLCQYVFEKTSEKSVVLSTWQYCNGQNGKFDLFKINPSRIKATSNSNMYGIHNFCDPDLDFIYTNIYNTNLFDNLNIILKLMSDNLNSRKKAAEKRRKLKNTKSQNKNLFVENVHLKVKATELQILSQDYKQMEVDLTKKSCDCGFFQVYLIPCCHAIDLIKKNNYDIYEYVDMIYSKDTLKEAKDVSCIVNDIVKTVDKGLLRRGPGRPKKKAN